MDLEGKVAIVTGAGRGIGKDISLGLAREGCGVALVSRSEHELAEVEREIHEMGVPALEIPADLAQREQIDQIVQRTLATFGTVDILINNAGTINTTPFLEVTEDEWDTTMNVNVKAPFLLGQQVLKVMKEKGNGHIINMSSTVAFGVPSYHTSYGTSKHAIVGLSQAMYESAKDFGVKVSVVYPGMTDTRMLRDLNLPIPPHRWMLPIDVAECVLFLLKQSQRVSVRELVPWAAHCDKV